VLYSRLSALATIYQFQVRDVKLAQSVSDPFTLSLNDMKSGHNSLSTPEKALSRIVFAPLRYYDNRRWEHSGLGMKYQDYGVKFHKLFALRMDLSIAESLYCSGLPSNGWNGVPEDQKFKQVEAPLLVQQRGKRLLKSSRNIDMAFVVEYQALDEISDVVDEFQSLAGRLHSSEVITNNFSKSKRLPEFDLSTQWTLNFKQAYDIAFLVEMVPNSDALSTAQVYSVQASLGEECIKYLNDDPICGHYMEALFRKVLMKRITGKTSLETL
jgi:RNA polymerase I-specific transcription-initiation factor